MLRSLTLASLILLVGCQSPAGDAKTRPDAKKVEDKPDTKLDTKVDSTPAPKGVDDNVAREFVDQVDKDLRVLLVASSKAEWEKNTNITDATEKAAAEANEKLMEYMGRTIKAATGIKTEGLDPETARKLHLIKTAASPPPAPSDPVKRKELAELGAKIEGIYGKGKYCKDPKKPKTCKDLGELSEIMAESRNYDALLDAWQGWHSIAIADAPAVQPLRRARQRGRAEIGFTDLGELWRSGYDMTPADFEEETERLWTQVKPLYDELHCYVRAKLVEKYGKEQGPRERPDPRAPARQHVGAGVGQHLPAGRAVPGQRQHRRHQGAQDRRSTTS